MYEATSCVYLWITMNFEDLPLTEEKLVDIAAHHVGEKCTKNDCERCNLWLLMVLNPYVFKTYDDKNISIVYENFTLAEDVRKILKELEKMKGGFWSGWFWGIFCRSLTPKYTLDKYVNLGSSDDAIRHMLALGDKISFAEFLKQARNVLN